MAVGRMKAGPERELVARYAERIEAGLRPLGFKSFNLIECDESRARRPEDRKDEEAKAILAQCAGRLILFDERGKTLSSPDFAALLGQWRDENAEATTLVIGGADGLSASLRAKADRVLSFGAMTLPHQLVRVLAAEQLYRACTILSGHPYHRT